jgi:CDP-diacylglycerol--glycerol-3-phosphate 3-phosphatidyltransferase
MNAAHQPSNLNIANVLTVVRIIGVPFFGWFLLVDDGLSIGWRVAAWAAFAVLMVTDRIDGDLARKYNLVTNFGKLADPIADKALTGMAFVGLSMIGQVWWWVTIVVLVREWGITAMRFVVKKYGVMPASQGGKLKTMVQALALAGYVLPFELWDTPLTIALLWVTHALMAAAVIITVVTGIQYVKDARDLRRSALASS